MVKDNNAVSRLEILDARSQRGYHARSFMTEDARRGVRAGGNLLEIGAADAAGVHPEQQFSRTYFGDGNRFQTDVVHAAIHGRQHSCRDGPGHGFERVWSGYGHRSFRWDTMNRRCIGSLLDLPTIAILRAFLTWIGIGELDVKGHGI